MDARPFIAIAGAAFLRVIISSGVRRYRAWKRERDALPLDVRNGPGQVSDRTLRVFEVVTVGAAALFAGWILYFIFWWAAHGLGWRVAPYLPGQVSWYSPADMESLGRKVELCRDDTKWVDPIPPDVPGQPPAIRRDHRAEYCGSY